MKSPGNSFHSDIHMNSCVFNQSHWLKELVEKNTVNKNCMSRHFLANDKGTLAVLVCSTMIRGHVSIHIFDMTPHLEIVTKQGFTPKSKHQSGKYEGVALDFEVQV